MQLTFNPKVRLKRTEQQIIAWLNKWLAVLKNNIDVFTPEDTYELIENTKIIPAYREWNKIIWQVENDTEYAVIVEEWVWQWENKRVYNYYKAGWRRKWGTPFYTNAGARMFQRWLDASRRKIEILLNLQK